MHHENQDRDNQIALVGIGYLHRWVLLQLPGKHAQALSVLDAPLYLGIGKLVRGTEGRVRQSFSRI